MDTKHDSILSTIGNTPVVHLDAFAPSGVRLYAKVESFNPMGSVKDRLALGIIEDAERRGVLRPGQTVIEATSGNTGIGLAMVCARKGYPLVVVMAENFSIERRRLLRFLGARVVLTPAALKGSGMLAKAEELAEQHGWFLTRQFENPANAEIHARTTAREILRDFEGERLDYWVCGHGTGGTLNGVAGVLRRERPDTRIVVCEPDNSPVLASGIPQARDAQGRAIESHPMFRPHPMQGIAPDFIPALAQQALDAGHVDRIVAVDGNDAFRCTRELARREGILCGISAGAILAGAIAVAREAAPGSTVLCMLPDTGERYLSTPLFEHIGADMDEAEWEIARSTPSARFDAPAPPPPAPEKPPPSATPEGVAAMREAIEDAEQPVVMFALTWCEFCWSVRRLFGRLGIPYRSVDLDAPALQHDDLGGQIRAALRERTGERTIPQVFVGREWIGGCSETFEALRSGRLAELLDANGVDYRRDEQVDPATLLPGWLQRR